MRAVPVNLTDAEHDFVGVLRLERGPPEMCSKTVVRMRCTRRGRSGKRNSAVPGGCSVRLDQRPSRHLVKKPMR